MYYMCHKRVQNYFDSDEYASYVQKYYPAINPIFHLSHRRVSSVRVKYYLYTGYVIDKTTINTSLTSNPYCTVL